MPFKNKFIAAALCVLAAGIGIFGSGSNVARAQINPTPSSTTIEQLQQIVQSLVQQIQAMVRIIAQLKPQETCGNGICRFDETAENCAADCTDSNTCSYINSSCCQNGKCTPRSSVNCVTIEKCDSKCQPVCAACGDGECSAGETAENCAADCGPVTCIGAGEYLGGNGENSAKVCCAGLTKVFDQWHLGSDGICRALDNYGFYCLKCGDGVCGTGENKCNCPADCNNANTCAAEGKTNYFGSPSCCDGLTNISNGTMTSDGSCIATNNGAGVCAKCGDGICGTGENKCNCPSDCGSNTAAMKCANTGGTWNTATSSCACPNYTNWCDDYGCDGARAAKPVIYLYPQKTTKANVKIDWAGKLIADYPDYDPAAGWNVMAYPDGHLINLSDGKEYSYLFWEGDDYGADYDMTRGFVVKGSETKVFLQKILAEIGLNPKEYNEFIVYWYPQMKDNPYNLIHFAAEEYTSRSRLEISPNPDSILRVFMVFKSLQSKINVAPQTFTPFARKGFTVVEWGGTEINH